MLSTSTLSIADGYLIVNTLLSQERGGRGRSLPLPDWFATAALSLALIELMGKSKAGREMLSLRRRNGMVWMNECLSMNINTVAISSLWLHSSHSFSSRKRTTCGASYKWQIPTGCSSPAPSPHNGLTYICIYSVTWNCSGLVRFRFSNTHTRSPPQGCDSRNKSLSFPCLAQPGHSSCPLAAVALCPLVKLISCAKRMQHV